ncbi:exopolyphosphatase/guanosine-5'-triphosphate,3'-diphosphate pyrophosphatase [Actinokineospora baliensis]|uniref:Ppx/GppA phosphatase family protein n=1 Tax=Actinokineospora baliensis TaxID=547056 RepID=UPI00195949F0|nr:exopolyphosphatase [Actinokineospora baliensis]MBM7773037.1 exopolyphosphatase/guanosine-5'-triphosphate,3'-diphosphate pyrophosphatase [Actinokineospora baliensis]
MRPQLDTVGVLDVGSFSAHLLVVAADQNAPLTPLYSDKVRLRLDRGLDASGRLRAEGVDAIAAAIAAVRGRARRAGLPIGEFVPFATSSVRDAANADEVVRRIARRTGVVLRTFTGQQEAQLAYLAARRWSGKEGTLTVLDVGGGTVEVATGAADEPLVAESLPYGARTLTALGLVHREAEVAELIRRALTEDDLAALHRGRAVGCSKVFGGLAKLAGRRTLRVTDLDRWIPRLARLSARRRAKLPGISRHRAEQSLAGAVAARALMEVTGHDAVVVSPWSTTQGLLLALREHRSELVGTDAA